MSARLGGEHQLVEASMFPAKGIACAKREETQLAQGVCSINFEVGQRRCVDLERVSSRVVTIVGGGGHEWSREARGATKERDRLEVAGLGLRNGGNVEEAWEITASRLAPRGRRRRLCSSLYWHFLVLARARILMLFSALCKTFQQVSFSIFSGFFFSCLVYHVYFLRMFFRVIPLNVKKHHHHRKKQKPKDKSGKYLQYKTDKNMCTYHL